jgi:hypothetical protein
VILSVTTLKDTVANVEKWVRRNLAGGIDHMIVFLDAPQPEVEALLAGRSEVTAVRAYDDWFGEEGDLSLNDRQIINAGLASRLLVGMPWADWLFHLDGDEVAQIDRAVLDRLAPETSAVRLTCLEAVSRLRPESDPTLFKPMPDQDVLTLLASLGLIRKADARFYFRGHRAGRPGVRPSPDLVLGTHNVTDAGTSAHVAAVEVPGLTLLHYVSYSSDEFVRKWTANLDSGADLEQNDHRALLAGAVSALLSLDLTEEARATWFDRLFERVALDDVDTLSRLRLLVEVDPDARVRPAPRVQPEDVAQLRTLLDRVHDVPKRQFHPRSGSGRAAKTVEKLRRGI